MYCTHSPSSIRWNNRNVLKILLSSLKSISLTLLLYTLVLHALHSKQGKFCINTACSLVYVPYRRRKQAVTFEGLPANKICLTAVVSMAVSSPRFRSISVGSKELNWHANGQFEHFKSYKETHSSVLG